MMNEITTEYYVKTVKEIQQLQQAIQDAKNEISKRISDLYEQGMKVPDIALATNYSDTMIYRLIHKSVEERKKAKE